MRWDARPPHWEKYKYKNRKRPRDNRTNGHIIQPRKVFEPMVCGCMNCAQIWAVEMFTKKQRRRPDRQRDRNTGRRMGIKT